MVCLKILPARAGTGSREYADRSGRTDSGPDSPGGCSDAGPDSDGACHGRPRRKSDTGWRGICFQ